MMKKVIYAICVGTVLATLIFFLGAFIFGVICNVMEKEYIYAIICLGLVAFNSTFIYILTKKVDKIVYSTTKEDKGSK